MKTKLILIALALSSFSFTGGDDKLTLKEIVEQNKEVKVFFNLRDIKDENDERMQQAANPNAKTALKTAMPADYAGSELKKEVLKILNEGLQVGNAFVEGDLSTLPESNNRKYHYRDLSKLPDGFYAIIDIDGEYTRTILKKDADGKTILEVSNWMEISSHLHFYSLAGGEATKYGGMFSKSGTLLGNARSATVKSTQLENLEYLEKTFPALSLLDEYKKTMYRFTKDFADKQLEKHNKSVSKRK